MAVNIYVQVYIYKHVALLALCFACLLVLKHGVSCDIF